MTPAPALSLTDAPERSRYEAHEAGELAGFVDYRAMRGRLTIIHTEVLQGREGRGVATRLARFVLDDVRARGLRIVIVCPFFRAYLARHPRDLDLVLAGGPGADRP